MFELFSLEGKAGSIKRQSSIAPIDSRHKLGIKLTLLTYFSRQLINTACVNCKNLQSFPSLTNSFSRNKLTLLVSSLLTCRKVIYFLRRVIYQAMFLVDFFTYILDSRCIIYRHLIFSGCNGYTETNKIASMTAICASKYQFSQC